MKFVDKAFRSEFHKIFMNREFWKLTHCVLYAKFAFRIRVSISLIVSFTIFHNFFLSFLFQLVGFIYTTIFLCRFL